MNGAVEPHLEPPARLKVWRAARDEYVEVLRGGSGSCYEQLLRFQHSSIEAMVSDVMTPPKRSVVFSAKDASGRVVAWAACFDFHRRPGYASVAHLALDVESVDTDAARQLIHACQAPCRSLGWRRLIAFTTPQLGQSRAALNGSGFESCGGILSARGRLELVSREIPEVMA